MLLSIDSISVFLQLSTCPQYPTSYFPFSYIVFKIFEDHYHVCWISCPWTHYHSKMIKKKYNINGHENQYNQTNTENHRGEIIKFWKKYIAFHFHLVLSLFWPWSYEGVVSFQIGSLKRIESMQRKLMKTPWRGSQNPESKENLAVSSIRENFQIIAIFLENGDISSFCWRSGPGKIQSLQLKVSGALGIYFPKRRKSLCLESVGNIPLKISPGY